MKRGKLRERESSSSSISPTLSSPSIYFATSEGGINGKKKKIIKRLKKVEKEKLAEMGPTLDKGIPHQYVYHSPEITHSQ